MKKLLTLLFVMAFLFSCAHHIKTFSGQIPQSSHGASPTLDQVGEAIVNGARTRQWGTWKVRIVEPGHAVAVLQHRGHMVAVDILYTTKDYRIEYKDSANMNYNGKDKIHGKYNQWVERLDMLIKNELLMLDPNDSATQKSNQ